MASGSGEHGGRLTRAIGLMSGTSMDGVDVAWLETDGRDDIRAGATAFRPYTPGERAAIRAALEPAMQVADRSERPPVLAHAEAIVTAAHREAVERFLSDHSLDRVGVDVVGFHGQTVFHDPGRGLTLQLGDGEELAESLGIPVVYDLRAADVAAGGQGAPLLPAYHRALAAASGLAAPVAILNVGGVANLTLIGDEPGAIFAFDTGPGNAPVDDLVAATTGAAMDVDGRIAAEGRVDADVLAQLMASPYFNKMPPKSLDRNAFPVEIARSLPLADACATLVAFAAEAVAVGLRSAGAAPNRLVVCGGGARNPTLMRVLAERCRVPVVAADSLGWNGDAIEAQGFAYLAVRSLHGLPLSFPGTTGVPRPQTGGRLATPQRRAA